MKNMKKVLASLLLVCMVFSMMAIPAVADSAGEIEVKLNRYGLPMMVGEVYDLTGSVVPENVGNVNLLWSSSNESVAAVDANGVVTALALGSAEITACTTDGLYSAMCQVVVADPVVNVVSITLDKAEFSMDMGGYASLIPTVYPENASVQRVVWLSSDENVLTVDENGNITALAAGTAFVSAIAAELDLSAETLNEALIAKCQVYVIDRAAEEAARLAAEQAEAERLAAEQAEAERLAAEQAEAERLAAEQAEAERLAAEQAEAERLAAEQAEAERLAAEQAEAERIAAEKAEAERLAAEQAEAERIAAEKAEAERIAAEKAEAERIAAEKAEAERIAAEKAEAERIAAEKAEAERIAAEQKAAAENVLVLPTVGVNAFSDPMIYASAPTLGAPEALSSPGELPTIIVHPYGTNLGFSTVEINNPTEIYVSLSNTSITSEVPYTWTITGNPGVIDLSAVEGFGSEKRNFTVLGAGETTVVVSREGVAQPSTITVTVVNDVVNISDSKTAMYIGDEYSFVAAGTYGTTAVEWSSGNTSVATVDASGLVKAVGAGTTTITATSASDKATPRASASVDVTVTDPNVYVTGVALNKYDMALYTGDTDTLVATVSPENATNKNVSWVSSAADVASVENGVVTALKAGTATITVTTADGGFQSSCAVTVTDPVIPVTGVSLSQSTLSLTPGSNNYSSPLVATVEPSNATNKSVTWSGSANGISVDANGVVSVDANAAVSATTIITATSNADNSKYASCIVTVANPAVPVTGVSLDKTSHTLTMGSYEGFTLNATVAPENASNKNVSWSSTASDVASVDSTGHVTAHKAGTAIIIVSTEDGGKTATCTVTVNPKPAVLVTEITLTGPSSSTTVGGTLQLTAVVKPDNAENKNVTWSSSNTSVATVDQTGKVTGIGIGTTNITATAQDGSGVSKSGAVTVTAPANGILYVSSNVNTISSAGGTAYLTARLADNSIVPNASINWTVNPADMATVSANGVVTPKRTGTFTVTGTFSANGVNYTGSTSIRMMPVIIYGNNATYDGSNTPLYFVVNDLSANARAVRVDGYTLVHGQHCYIYDHQGYIAVALNPAFLKTLSPSVVHNIQIDSTNGTATGYFRIYGYSSSINGVKTGDENQAALWAALLFVSVIGMGTVLVSRRKEWNGR